METDSQFHTEQQGGDIRSGNVLMGRMTWMMFGPVALLFAIYAIVSQGSGWFAIADVAYGAVVALMVGGRWMEQRSGSATTAAGEPATAEHYKRYVRTLLPIAAGAWVAANVLGNHLLT